MKCSSCESLQNVLRLSAALDGGLLEAMSFEKPWELPARARPGGYSSVRDRLLFRDLGEDGRMNGGSVEVPRLVIWGSGVFEASIGCGVLD